MATRNIVPRATGEGGIGTVAKKWLSAYISNLYSPNLVLGSDADGDMYYRAASVLARLAKGAANLKLFMNAAGTAPEWANGFFFLSSTRAMDTATGDVSYTGTGFKPSAIFAIASLQSSFSFGFAAGTEKGAVYAYPGVGYPVTYDLCYLHESGGKTQSAIVKSYDADGFTLTWTRTGATAARITNVFFLLMR